MDDILVIKVWGDGVKYRGGNVEGAQHLYCFTFFILTIFYPCKNITIHRYF